jgi:3'-phosphoadenosine 5'-phosphosulfate (PAPS) 3'-phosphatase
VGTNWYSLLMVVVVVVVAIRAAIAKEQDCALQLKQLTASVDVILKEKTDAVLHSESQARQLQKLQQEKKELTKRAKGDGSLKKVNLLEAQVESYRVCRERLCNRLASCSVLILHVS